MNWEEAPTYYEQPIIKEPVWTWEIPCYFFTGGMGTTNCQNAPG